MGSGCLAAMGVFESTYRDNMSEEDAKNMCIQAIEAGIYHDLGSGSNVDVSIITRGKVEYIRSIRSDNKKIYSKPDGYKFHKERVQVLAEYKQKGLIIEESGPQPMELSWMGMAKKQLN